MRCESDNHEAGWGSWRNSRSRHCALGIVFAGGRNKPAPPTPPPPQVTVLTVQRQTIPGQFEWMGQAAASKSVQVRGTRNQVAAQQTQVDALRRALRLAEMRYQSGASSYLDLLDAQRSLFSADPETFDPRSRSYRRCRESRFR